MNIEDIAESATVPYTTALKEFDWWGFPFQSKQLSFTMQAQLASNWCWAATASSVSRFFWSWSTWAQCTIANAELGRNDACNSPIPSGANVPWYLDRSLARTNNFVSIHSGPASFATIRAEIDAGRPVGARIGWSGGGGHFMVIYGYAKWLNTEWVYIDDPIYGKSQLTLSNFTNNYQGSGTWTHYYLTKSFRLWWWPNVTLNDRVFTKLWEAREHLHLAAATDPAHVRQSAGERPSEPDQARFGLTQPTFALGLDQLLSGENTDPKPVGLRVFETLDGKPVAFYDVDDADEGAVRAASQSETRLDAFASAIGVAAPQVTGGGEGTETRILQVPALNFEAFWVVQGEDESVLVPLLGAAGLEPGQSYPLQDALDKLREAAQPFAGMDDTMGA
ncbi:MAG: papain-like cysteine protease family protein [Propioniciclava sp.]|uniref:papain-like cysteine protease family protein n=1 Tax=Propioniciclava sp. TaxID=2038686 RepID=UPI0039E5AA25